LCLLRELPYRQIHEEEFCNRWQAYNITHAETRTAWLYQSRNRLCSGYGIRITPFFSRSDVVIRRINVGPFGLKPNRGVPRFRKLSIN
jgi:hypothetical protein